MKPPLPLRGRCPHKLGWKWRRCALPMFFSSYEVERLSDGESMNYFSISDLLLISPLQQLAEVIEAED